MVIAERPTTTQATFEEAVDALERRVSGTVVRPSDAAYDAVRLVQQQINAGRPSVIVRAANTWDVAEAVRFARAQDFPVAVKSGGHNFIGLGMPDRAVVVDMSALLDYSIDPERKVLRTRPGVRTVDMIDELKKHQLILSTGDVKTVGLGGLVTGGGIGWLVRKHGMAIDNLISAEVVTADGQVLRASETQNSDLFWAVRGGGGNFGIITEFEFRLNDHSGMIYGGAIALEPTAETLRKVIEYARTAPDELTTITAPMPLPPAPFVPEGRVGDTAVVVLVAYSGDLDEGEKVVAPFREMGDVIIDLLGPAPYESMYMFTAAAEAPNPFHVRSGFFDEVTDEMAERFIAGIDRSSATMAMVQIRPMGGQFARVAADATAFAHRDAGYMISVIAEWHEQSENETHVTWGDKLWDEFSEESRGVYANFLGHDGKARIREAYPGATYERLLDVKRRYDPENVFRFNQNISPEDGAARTAIAAG